VADGVCGPADIA
jgi:hypothetical protein